MRRDYGADLRGAIITRIGSTELITPEMRGVDLRGALIMCMGSTELITPDMRGCGEIMVRRDYGADIRGAIITRIGSTELITPEMRGVGRSWCGSKGSYDHTHRIHRTDNPGNEGCGETMVRI